MLRVCTHLFCRYFNVICLTISNLSGILDTTDTSFVHPWGWGVQNYGKHADIILERSLITKLFTACDPVPGGGDGVVPGEAHGHQQETSRAG